MITNALTWPKRKQNVANFGSIDISTLDASVDLCSISIDEYMLVGRPPNYS